MAQDAVRQVEEIQARQLELRTKIYAAFAAGHSCVSPQMIGLNRAYDKTVAKLEALLGEDAACGAVDCDLASAFSDQYKDALGCRPRHHVTRAQVKEWLAEREDGPVAA